MGGGGSKSRPETSDPPACDRSPVFVQDHEDENQLSNGAPPRNNGAPHVTPPQNKRAEESSGGNHQSGGADSSRQISHVEDVESYPSSFSQPAANKPSSFSQPKDSSGFSKPNPGFSKSNPEFSQATPGIGQPNPGFSQLNAGLNQPSSFSTPITVTRSPNQPTRSQPLSHGDPRYLGSDNHSVTTTISSRPPLKFDQNNISPYKPPVPAHFDKSMNFYNQTREKQGRHLTTPTTPQSLGPSHMSGVYNRHSGHVTSNGVDNSASSLLRRDKFSLMGSQLQQQESKIFSRSLQQHSNNNTTPPSLTRGAPSSTKTDHGFPNSSFTSQTARFDPNKFRRVNDGVTGATSLCTVPNGSLKSSGHGPLDERDEELIASIEQEFRFA